MAELLIEHRTIMKGLLLSLLSLAFSLPGFAQGVDLCGDPPPVANEAVRGEIEGKAQFLSRFLGDVALTGNIQTSRTEIFSKYGDAEFARSNAYFEYQVCVLLMSDKSLTNIQKIDKLREIRREFSRPVETHREKSSIQDRYINLVYLGLDLAVFTWLNKCEKLPPFGLKFPYITGPSAVIQTIRGESSAMHVSDAEVRIEKGLSALGLSTFPGRISRVATDRSSKSTIRKYFLDLVQSTTERRLVEAGMVFYELVAYADMNWTGISVHGPLLLPNASDEELRKEKLIKDFKMNVEYCAGRKLDERVEEMKRVLASLGIGRAINSMPDKTKYLAVRHISYLAVPYFIDGFALFMADIEGEIRQHFSG